MIALNVQDVKDFMARLLISEEFDSFWLCEASITTFSTFQIDGTLRPEFFDTEEAEALKKRSHLLPVAGSKALLFFYYQREKNTAFL